MSTTIEADLEDVEHIDDTDDTLDLGEEVVAGEESMQHMINLATTAERRFEEIAIDDIIPPELKKVGRSETIIGLTGIVDEFGVASPIHVMVLEDADMFLLFDGVRRLYSAVSLGKKTVPAIVWDFEDKEEAKKHANKIGLMLNRSQSFTNREIWNQYIMLERVNGLSVGEIEYYLQLNAGDAVKVKDVMESDYVEIQDEFLEGALTIEGAYKKLNAERKKENKLAKEEGTALGVYSDGEGEEDNFRLNKDEVLDLLEFNETSETIETLNKSDTGEIPVQEGVTMQDPKNRKPLDPKLRAAVLERDQITCQCCHDGGEQYLQILDIHHIIQVSQGGMDIEDNLVTVCINCHHNIHWYAWGRMIMKTETLDNMSKRERDKFSNIFRFGNKIIEANKRLGDGDKSKQLVNRKMPGTGFKDNVEAYNSYKEA